MTEKTKKELRSRRWYGVADLRSFNHRSRELQMGYGYDDFMGKPVVAIINTWSDSTLATRISARASRK